MSEETIWITRARAGDQDAFVRLIETYQAAVFNLAYRMLGDAAEAEDAAQEAFLRAYTRLSSYDTQRPFKTWLFAITSHHCLDRLRRRRPTRLSLDQPLAADDTAKLAEPTPGPEERAMRSEREAALQKHLARLSPEDRAVIVMRYWYDMSYQEIAQTTETTVSAVKSRLHRARLSLAEKIAGERRDAPAERRYQAHRRAEALP